MLSSLCVTTTMSCYCSACMIEYSSYIMQTDKYNVVCVCQLHFLPNKTNTATEELNKLISSALQGSLRYIKVSIEDGESLSVVYDVYTVEVDHIMCILLDVHIKGVYIIQLTVYTQILSSCFYLIFCWLCMVCIFSLSSAEKLIPDGSASPSGTWENDILLLYCMSILYQ